jgi:RNA polymerase sigma-70 factor (ECF subfamily)
LSENTVDVPALVARSRTGDREAFSALVLRFQDVVYNIIHQRLGDADAALDAAQETFVNAYSGIATFRGEASFKSWLLAIALREAENQRRKKKRQLPAGGLNGVDPADRGPSPDHGASSDDDAALVRRALREADEDDARLILLRDLENLSYLEIAEALGVPIGTVKSGLSRARARLRTALERALEPAATSSRRAVPDQVR